MEEREPAKYAIGDIVRLHSYESSLWRVEDITWWKEPAPEIFKPKMHPYFHLRNITTNETCEEFNSTIFCKDEGANLLYE